MINTALFVSAAILVVAGIVHRSRVAQTGRSRSRSTADRGLAARTRTPIWASAFVLAVVGTSGLAVFAPPASVSAANVAVEQCNGVSNTGGLTVECSVVVVNNVTGDPATEGSCVSLNGGAAVCSSDLVTSVNQCNGSANGGGGTLLCSVSITNNISVSGASAPTGATVNQCNANQPDGLGTAPHVCVPFPATTTGATITQCNGSGNGGGLVSPSGCTASGLVSSTFPVTINQCNDSANGGGARVVCSATMLTNVIAVPPTTEAPTPTTEAPTPTTEAPPTTIGDYPPVPPTPVPTTAPSAGSGTSTTAPSGGTPTTAASGGASGTPSAPAGPGAPATGVPSLPRTGASSWLLPLFGGGMLLTALGGALLLAVGRHRARS